MRERQRAAGDCSSVRSHLMVHQARDVQDYYHLRHLAFILLLARTMYLPTEALGGPTYLYYRHSCATKYALV